MKNIINDNSVVDLHLVDLKSTINTYGSPGKSSDKNDWIKYSNFIVDIGIDESKNIDFILIDGHFRVACSLKCFDTVNQTFL